MAAYPTQISRRPPDRIEIAWSDGRTRTYRFRELRDACPCATCREKRREGESSGPPPLVVLRPEELVPLDIRGMTPVGNYAYNISFSDGHDTGIFTFAFLQELGEEVS